MPIQYHPSRGEVLICDFDSGFKPPEMVKRRPVIIVSPKQSHGRGVCTVVPISTTAPFPVQGWHHQLPHLLIPGWKATGVMWAKSDMIATVAFERLNKTYIKTRHGRNHVTLMLDQADIDAIDQCLRNYLRI